MSGTTHHAGRRKIGERIGSHVGSNDRLERHRPANRIVYRALNIDGRAASFGRRFQMNAEFLKKFMGIAQDVRQRRNWGPW